MDALQKYYKSYALSVGLGAATVGTLLFLKRFGIFYQLFHKVNKTPDCVQPFTSLVQPASSRISIVDMK